MVSRKILSSMTAFNIDNKKYFVSIKSAYWNKGSCDTEDGSNDCWKFNFAITGISYIVKYIKIENSYFKMQ